MPELQHPGKKIEAGTGGKRSKTGICEMLEVMREHVDNPIDH